MENKLGVKTRIAVHRDDLMADVLKDLDVFGL